MRFLFVVAMIATVGAAPQVAAAPGPDTEPAPDCATFSLEGVRIGMSLAAAQAATPGWKWKDRGDGNGKRGDRWTATKATKGRDAHLDVYLGPGGRVRDAARDYVQRKASGVFEMEVVPSALSEAFTQRFGPVATKGDGVVVRGTDSFGNPDAVYTMTCWVSVPCNMDACIEDGSRWSEWAGAQVIELPVLNATISDAGAVDADVSAGAAKVKF